MENTYKKGNEYSFVFFRDVFLIFRNFSVNIDKKQVYTIHHKYVIYSMLKSM